MEMYQLGHNISIETMFHAQVLKELLWWTMLNLRRVGSIDVALAMVSMRQSPIGPIMEKLCLSLDKYGTASRFYIQTLDRALSHVQEKLVIYAKNMSTLTNMVLLTAFTFKHWIALFHMMSKRS